MSSVQIGALNRIPIVRKLTTRSGLIGVASNVLHDIRLKAPPRPTAVTKTEDMVGIFDSSYSQLFALARPVRASVYEDATLFKHPLETGYTVADHRIILPVEISIALKLPPASYRDVYNAVRAGFQAGDTYTVRTRTGNYSNMILASMPHEERPEDWDSIPLFLSFVELQTNSATYKPLAPRRIGDTSTINKGQQNTGSLGFQLLQGAKAKIAQLEAFVQRAGG